MTNMASATAADPATRRMPRRRPRVPGRLFAGILLVVASVAGVAALVDAADRTEPLLVARHVIAAGDPVTADDLVAVPTKLGRGAARYLVRVPRAASIAGRTIGAGELVPVAAVVPAVAAGTTSVVLAVAGQPAAAIAPGARVDVWSAMADAEASEPPAALVSGATVVRLVRDEGFGASSGVAIEVRVPKEAVAAVLHAVAVAAQITVLPAAG